jgi:hypothetical protein
MKVQSRFSHSWVTGALFLFASPFCYAQSDNDLYQYASKFFCGNGGRWSDRKGPLSHGDQYPQSERFPGEP